MNATATYTGVVISILERGHETPKFIGDGIIESDLADAKVFTDDISARDYLGEQFNVEVIADITYHEVRVSIEIL